MSRRTCSRVQRVLGLRSAQTRPASPGLGEHARRSGSAMRRSVLASVISTLPRKVVKNGQSSISVSTSSQPGRAGGGQATPDPIPARARSCGSGSSRRPTGSRAGSPGLPDRSPCPRAGRAGSRCSARRAPPPASPGRRTRPGRGARPGRGRPAAPTAEIRSIASSNRASRSSSIREVRCSTLASITAASRISRLSRARLASAYLSETTSPCSVSFIAPSSTPYGDACTASPAGPPPRPTEPPRPWKRRSRTP